VAALTRLPRSTLAEFLDDRVTYRSLDTVDRRLPRCTDLAASIGLADAPTPRKCQPCYGQLVAALLREAAKIEGNGAVDRILFVGDTRGNDIRAFEQICHEGAWPGIAFIGRDDPSAPEAWQMVGTENGPVLIASRWRLLTEVDRFCDADGFPIDRRTVVLIDIDKTAIGARGRNDEAIDRARIDALHRTYIQVHGEVPEWSTCQRLYRSLNRDSLHRFTADNQDLVVYMALAVAANLLPDDILLRDDAWERFGDLAGLLAEADRGAPSASRSFRDAHRAMRDGLVGGELPLFDRVRRNEYEATVGRMSRLPEAATMDRRLADEIMITAEVREVALRWRDRGALVFGISDKPDIASLPTEAQADSGLLPLHRTQARVMAAIESENARSV